MLLLDVGGFRRHAIFHKLNSNCTIGSCFLYRLHSSMISSKIFWERLLFVVVSFSTNHSKRRSLFAQIVLAALSSTSIDDKDIFSSLIRSYHLLVDSHPQEVLRHFDTLITTNGEGEGGTKLAMTLEQIYFRKDSISGCISLLDELGVQTTRKRPLLTFRE